MSTLFSSSANTALATGRMWHKVDIQNRTLGKVAARIAVVLMGKHKPVFDRGTDCGDYVVVTNCEKVFVSGNTAENKYYFKPSTFPGASRHIPFKEVMDRRPEDIIARAVSRMLPKNKLRKLRLARLKVFQGPENPYESNIVKRYDLSVTGAWEGKGEVPKSGEESSQWEWERKRKDPIGKGWANR